MVFTTPIMIAMTLRITFMTQINTLKKEITTLQMETTASQASITRGIIDKVLMETWSAIKPLLMNTWKKFIVTKINTTTNILMPIVIIMSMAPS